MAASSNEFEEKKSGLELVGKIELKKIEGTRRQLFLRDGIMIVDSSYFSAENKLITCLDSYALDGNKKNLFSARYPDYLHTSLVEISPSMFAFIIYSITRDDWRLILFDNEKIKFNLTIYTQDLHYSYVPKPFHIHPDHPHLLICFYTKRLGLGAKLLDLKKNIFTELDFPKLYAGGILDKLEYVNDKIIGIIRWGAGYYHDGTVYTHCNQVTFAIDFLSHQLRPISKLELNRALDGPLSPSNPCLRIMFDGNELKVYFFGKNTPIELENNLNFRLVNVWSNWLPDGTLLVSTQDAKEIYQGTIRGKKIIFQPLEVPPNCSLENIQVTPDGLLVLKDQSSLCFFSVKSMRDYYKTLENPTDIIHSETGLPMPLARIVTGYVGHEEHGPAPRPTLPFWEKKNVKEEKEVQEIFNLHHYLMGRTQQWTPTETEAKKIMFLNYLIEKIRDTQSLKTSVEGLMTPDAPREFREILFQLLKNGSLPLLKKFLKKNKITIPSPSAGQGPGP